MKHSLTNLITDLRDAKPGLDRIAELNQGSITERITRLAAISYADDLKADGFSIVDSAGPCVLGWRPEAVNAADGTFRADFVMAGPTGLHSVNATAREQKAASQVVTARVAIHWLGYLAANGVEVPAELDAKMEQRGRREQGIEDGLRFDELETNPRITDLDNRLVVHQAGATDLARLELHRTGRDTTNAFRSHHTGTAHDEVRTAAYGHDHYAAD